VLWQAFDVQGLRKVTVKPTETQWLQCRAGRRTLLAGGAAQW